MPIIFKKLRIHVWGGLGSQLFAVALAYRIKKDFPRRELSIVLHTGGVTRRLPEVYELFPEFHYVEVDDFKPLSMKSNYSWIHPVRSSALKSLRFIALLLGLLAEENDGKSRAIKKWTLAIRGHYFHREIEDSFLQILAKRLHEFAGEFEIEKGVLHYRLGDLLDLATKNAISPDRVNQAIGKYALAKEFLIFSDSPDRALNLVASDALGVSFRTAVQSTPATIIVAANANFFIGTSSKLSYWISLLRSRVYDNSRTLMPIEDNHVFRNLKVPANSITFY